MDRNSWPKLQASQERLEKRQKLLNQEQEISFRANDVKTAYDSCNGSF